VGVAVVIFSSNVLSVHDNLYLTDAETFYRHELGFQFLSVADSSVNYEVLLTLHHLGFTIDGVAEFSVINDERNRASRLIFGHDVVAKVK
jgi:hypothetical protein